MFTTILFAIFQFVNKCRRMGHFMQTIQVCMTLSAEPGPCGGPNWLRFLPLLLVTLEALLMTRDDHHNMHCMNTSCRQQLGMPSAQSIIQISCKLIASLHSCSAFWNGYSSTIITGKLFAVKNNQNLAWPIDWWIEFLCQSWHKIGRFGNVLASHLPVSTEETRPNKTRATIHLEHKNTVTPK